MDLEEQLIQFIQDGDVQSILQAIHTGTLY